jgi:hypothetical protein
MHRTHIVLHLSRGERRSQGWVDLADSLMRLGAVLINVREFGDALAAAEAALIAQELRTIDADRYEDLMQHAVRNLATDLRDLGHDQAYIETEIQRLLATDN